MMWTISERNREGFFLDLTASIEKTKSFFIDSNASHDFCCRRVKNTEGKIDTTGFGWPWQIKKTLNKVFRNKSGKLISSPCHPWGWLTQYISVDRLLSNTVKPCLSQSAFKSIINLSNI